MGKRVQSMEVVEEMVYHQVKESTGQDIIEYVIWIMREIGVLSK